LENGRSKNDEIFRGMWETVETSAREIRVGKAEGGRSKRRSGEKEGGEEEEEETEKGKDNGGEEGSRGMGNMRGKRRSSEIRGGGKKDGARKIS